MRTATDSPESESEQPQAQAESAQPTGFESMIVCESCGARTQRLHLGCQLCEDCCDCRPG
jgi:hypothetical protein